MQDFVNIISFLGNCNYSKSKIHFSYEVISKWIETFLKLNLNTILLES